MNVSEHHGTCARTVGKALLFLETVSSRDLTFTEKESPRDLVSRADLAIHNLIAQELDPYGVPVVSEENVSSHAAQGSCVGLRWLLDPIDGTTNFANRIPFYGISLGLMQGAAFVGGAFGMPMSRELFYTVSEDASYLNDARLRACPTILAASLVGACFSSRASSATWPREAEFRAFGLINDRSRGCVRLGSAAASICYAAAGKLGASYGINSKLWDVAAALAIARAGDCQVLVAQAADPLALSFVVGHGKVVAEIQSTLQAELGITSWTQVADDRT
jgi:myo-inositol-1(or 4)-monophosphatase